MTSAEYQSECAKAFGLLKVVFAGGVPSGYPAVVTEMFDWFNLNSSGCRTDSMQVFNEMMDILEDVFEEMRNEPVENRPLLDPIYQWYCKWIDTTPPYKRI